MVRIAFARVFVGWALALWVVPVSAFAEGKAPLDLETNSSTAWKMLHPAFLTQERYAACRSLLPQLIEAGAELVFPGWDGDVPFARRLRQVYPLRPPEFYQKFHQIIPNFPIDKGDIWKKDSMLPCTDGEDCVLLTPAKDVLHPEALVGVTLTQEQKDWIKDTHLRPRYRAKLSEAIAKEFGLRTEALPYHQVEGGNLIPVGKHHMLVTTQLLDQAAADPYFFKDPETLTPAQQARLEQLRQKTKAFFEKRFQAMGRKTTVWLPTLEGEGTGHADMYINVLNDTVFVGQMTKKDLDTFGRDAEEKAYFRKIATAMEIAAVQIRQSGLKVQRIPQPPPFRGEFDGKEDEHTRFPSYANSLRVYDSKGKVTLFVPDPLTIADLEKRAGYKEAWKKAAQKSFESTGATVKWISPECSKAIEDGYGSISCATGACPKVIQSTITNRQRASARTPFEPIRRTPFTFEFPRHGKESEVGTFQHFNIPAAGRERRRPLAD